MSASPKVPLSCKRPVNAGTFDHAWRGTTDCLELGLCFEDCFACEDYGFLVSFSTSATVLWRCRTEDEESTAQLNQGQYYK